MFAFLTLQFVESVILCIFILTGRDILLVRRLIEQPIYSLGAFCRTLNLLRTQFHFPEIPIS